MRPSINWSRQVSRLNEVPAYQQFVYDLTGTLKAINIIY